MLGNTYNKLFFPKLKFVRKVSFSSWSSKKKTAIYKLDWTQFDKFILEARNNWIEMHKQNDTNMDFNHAVPPALPKKYEKLIQDLRFAIPTNYKREITYFAKFGLSEWQQERNFDTSIRDLCLKPGIEAINVAFRLITDCTYSNKRNDFYRGDNCFMIANLLIYRFWSSQTGRGRIYYNAELDKLEQHDNWDVNNKNYMTLRNELIKSIKENEATWEKYFPNFDVIVDSNMRHNVK
tara:strand:+ start:924 stop:1631 length:708 start_codon:yes stop_codon:yes gene_type:complete